MPNMQKNLSHQRQSTFFIVIVIALIGLTFGRIYNSIFLKPGTIEKNTPDWNLLNRSGCTFQIMPPVDAKKVTYEILTYQEGNWSPVEYGTLSFATISKKEQTVSVTGYANGSFVLVLSDDKDKSIGSAYSIGSTEYKTDYVSAGYGNNGSAILGRPFPLLYMGYTDDLKCNNVILSTDDFFQASGPSNYSIEYEAFRILTVTFS